MRTLGRASRLFLGDACIPRPQTWSNAMTMHTDAHFDRSLHIVACGYVDLVPLLLICHTLVWGPCCWLSHVLTYFCSIAARQLLSEAGGSVETAVGIFFSSQHGSAAARSRASTPTEQLRAILGPDVPNGQLSTLLRDAHNDVQGAVNLFYQRQGMRCPPNLALLEALASYSAASPKVKILHFYQVFWMLLAAIS